MISRRALLSSAWGSTSFARQPAALTGTFLQLAGPLLSWRAGEWARAFDRFGQLRLSEVIVQWTSLPDRDLGDSVRWILDNARRTRIGVWLGLFHDDAYWRKLGDAGYLDQLAARSVAGISALQRAAQGCRLRGFYMPQEIDDVNWRTQEQRSALKRFISSHVRAAAPHRVAVSAFSNGTDAPADYARDLRNLQKETQFDTLLFQDGIGVRKLTLDSLPPYVRALRKSLGRRLRVVVELFEQTSGNSEPFAAKPADRDRIQRQLEIARETRPIGFSVPEYLF